MWKLAMKNILKSNTDSNKLVLDYKVGNTTESPQILYQVHWYGSNSSITYCFSLRDYSGKVKNSKMPTTKE